MLTASFLLLTAPGPVPPAPKAQAPNWETARIIRGVDGYWDVSEAEISAETPNQPVPNLFGLSGGPKRSVLIRFGQVDRRLPGQTVKAASLELHRLEEGTGKIKSVRMLLRPWMPPGMHNPAQRLRPIAPKKDKKDAKKAAPQPPFEPGVTWNKAGGDVANWQSPGAIGLGDSVPINAEITEASGTILISKLEAAIESHRINEGENFGLLIEFESPVELWGSLAPRPADRPQLVVQTEVTAPAEPPQLTPVPTESGVQLVANRALKSVEVYRGAEKLTGVVSGVGTATVEVNLRPGSSQDPRAGLFKIVAKDAAGAVEVLPWTMTPKMPSKPVAIGPRDALAWNAGYCDSSRYSFAPFGALTYVRPNAAVGQGVQAVEAAFRTDAWRGTHLADLNLPPALSLPVRPTRGVLYRSFAMTESGPLPMSAVDQLLNGPPKIPTSIVAQITNTDGIPLGNTAVVVSAAGAPPKRLQTDDKGNLLLPLATDITTSGVYTLSAESGGMTESCSVPLDVLSNLFARGNKRAAVITVPFNLPALPINLETDLALGKPVRDSEKSFPAQLVSLVDESPATVYSLPEKEGAWVEIDLGRDRLLGQIELEGTLETPIKVMVYGTTDEASQADVWIDEPNVRQFQAAYGQHPRQLIIRPTSNTARFIRIVRTAPGRLEIGALRIFAARR